jgi:hypothetical protein
LKTLRESALRTKSNESIAMVEKLSIFLTQNNRVINTDIEEFYSKSPIKLKEDSTNK